MRIFFYANTDIYDRSKGVSNKVLNQIKALRNMGHEVFYTSYINCGIQILDNENKVVREKYYRISPQFFKYLRRGVLIQNTYQYFLSQGTYFDMCYVRFHFFDRKYCSMLRTMKKYSKVIIEAHGYPYREWKRWKLIPLYIRDIIFQQPCSRYVDLVAAISNHENIWGRKTVFIDNAVDVTAVKIHERIPEDNVIKLISVAIEQPYHGFEKVIIGLDNYYKCGGTREISIFMVGEYSEKTKKLVNKLNLDQHIIFTGKLYGKELEDIYNKSDLAIGSFSKRANDEYGSSIKTKEFFAKGIPFINGWKEYAFDDSYPYMKRFDMNDAYIDFNSVVDFYDSIKNNKNIPLEMRKFAEEHFVWEKQFEKIFNMIFGS